MVGMWRPATLSWFGADLITAALAITMVREPSGWENHHIDAYCFPRFDSLNQSVYATQK